MDSKKSFTGAADVFFTETPESNANTHTHEDDNIKNKETESQYAHTYEYKYKPTETKTRRLQLLLKPSTYEKMQAGAARMGMSVNEFVAMAVDSFLK